VRKHRKPRVIKTSLAVASGPPTAHNFKEIKMSTGIPHRHIGEAERLRIRALQRVPVLSVEDQARAIVDAWKRDRKPGIEYFFHGWSDRAPAECFDDRQHKRDVRARIESFGFVLGD